MSTTRATSGCARLEGEAGRGCNVGAACGERSGGGRLLSAQQRGGQAASQVETACTPGLPHVPGMLRAAFVQLKPAKKPPSSAQTRLACLGRAAGGVQAGRLLLAVIPQDGDALLHGPRLHGCRWLLEGGGRPAGQVGQSAAPCKPGSECAGGVGVGGRQSNPGAAVLPRRPVKTPATRRGDGRAVRSCKAHLSRRAGLGKPGAGSERNVGCSTRKKVAVSGEKRVPRACRVLWSRIAGRHLPGARPASSQ